MNIETGVFTTVTSGYYIVTFSAYVSLLDGELTQMYLYHNGVVVDESEFYTQMQVGSGDFIADQGSRTVVNIVFNCFSDLTFLLIQILHLLAGDTLDLRTINNGYLVQRITLCLYMAPAPYGLKG